METGFEKTSCLTPPTRQWISNFLIHRPWFNFYWQSSLRALKRGLDNRSYLRSATGNGLILAIHFDQSDVFTIVGEVEERELSRVLDFGRRGEVHVEAEQLTLFCSLAKDRVRRIDEVCFFRTTQVPDVWVPTSQCRLLQEEEQPALLEFYNRYYPETNISQWMFQLPFVALWDEDLPVASAGTMLLEERSCHIGNFLTHPEKRGKSYGEIVGRLLMNELGKLGVEEFMLGVFRSNPTAIQLYSKLGFQLLETRQMLYLSAR